MDIMSLVVPLTICLGTIAIAAIVYFVVASIKTRAAERREREAYARVHAQKPHKAHSHRAR